MKKEENQLQQVPKHRSVYRYQLKATNQILKDTRELCRSSMHSSGRTHQLHHPPYEDYDVSGLNDHSGRRLSKSVPSRQVRVKPVKQAFSRDFLRQKNEQKQVFQEFGYIQSSFHKEKQGKQKYKKPREEQLFDGTDYLNHNFLYQYSDHQNYRSSRNINHDKSAESQSRKFFGQEIKKDNKKQRRGLAEISLKVKNIVARMRKMTFKEVSDEVLKQSQDDLPADPEYLIKIFRQRQKQTKNIRRRVYDALNVLVSVEILKKQSRYVIHTTKTCIPGKKLSQHWNMINEKKRLLQQKRSDYSKKRANLLLLQKNIQMMQQFHKRNKQINELQDKKQQKTVSQIRQNINSSKRWYFPLVFLIPPRNLTSKVVMR